MTRSTLLNGKLEDSLSKQLERIGFPLSSSEFTRRSNDCLDINLAKYLPFLNEFAFRHRGTDQGNVSLHVLEMLSKRRVLFDLFSAAHDIEQDSITEASERVAGRSVISHQQQVLSPSAIDEVMDIVDIIKSRQWLSTNPDSVDGLPSLHLNLITNGKPLFDGTPADDISGDGGAATTTFPQCISKIVDILHPYIQSSIAIGEKATNSSTVEISDVFVRNYGKMEHRQF